MQRRTEASSTSRSTRTLRQCALFSPVSIACHSSHAMQHISSTKRSSDVHISSTTSVVHEWDPSSDMTKNKSNMLWFNRGCETGKHKSGKKNLGGTYGTTREAQRATYHRLRFTTKTIVPRSLEHLIVANLLFAICADRTSTPSSNCCKNILQKNICRTQQVHPSRSNVWKKNTEN